jgi:hypothetical protein
LPKKIKSSSDHNPVLFCNAVQSLEASKLHTLSVRSAYLMHALLLVPACSGMERHPILRPICEYEANYIYCAGYWMSFSAATMAERGEALKKEGTTSRRAERFDNWGMMAVRYGLRLIGLRVEFYKRSARDLMHARLVMSMLNKPLRYDTTLTTWMTSW